MNALSQVVHSMISCGTDIGKDLWTHEVVSEMPDVCWEKMIQPKLAELDAEKDPEFAPFVESTESLKEFVKHVLHALSTDEAFADKNTSAYMGINFEAECGKEAETYAVRAGQGFTSGTGSSSTFEAVPVFVMAASVSRKFIECCLALQPAAHSLMPTACYITSRCALWTGSGF